MLETMSPRATVGDGNCAYRAVSLALFGDQSHHTYVRLKAAIELMDHPMYYDNSSANFVVADTQIPTDSYSKLLSDVLTDGAYAEITHLYAISAALESPLQSYMPPMSIRGGCDPYTCIVIGRGVRMTQSPACTLMWTSCTVPTPGAQLKVNHLVWLADLQKSDVIDVDASHGESVVAGDASSDASVAVAHADGSSAPHAKPVVDVDDLPGETQSVAGSDASYAEPVLDQDASDDLTVDVSHADGYDATAAVNTPSQGIPLPNKGGLSTLTVVNLLTADAAQLPYQVFSSIPHGSKSNVYFLVKNDCNVTRRQAGKQAAFDDDCGAWNSQCAGSAKFPYLRTEGSSLRRLFWIASQGKYCREMKVDKQRVYVPLEPQPADDDVLTLVRYYTTSAASNNYKRRVTYITSTKFTAKISDRFVVE